MLNIVSVILGVVAALGLLLGLLPLFGWLNWIFTVPPAVLGLIFGLLSRSRGGAIFCGVVLALAALRLSLGGGIL